MTGLIIRIKAIRCVVAPSRENGFMIYRKPFNTRFTSSIWRYAVNYFLLLLQKQKKPRRRTRLLSFWGGWRVSNPRIYESQSYVLTASPQPPYKRRFNSLIG